MEDGSRGGARSLTAAASNPRVARHMTTAPASVTGARSAPLATSYDDGLRAYMLGVYNLMLMGVAFSGIVTMTLVSMPDVLAALSANPLFPIIIFLGTLGLSWCSPLILASESAIVGHLFFWIYCALWGAGLAPAVSFLLEQDAGSVVVRAFFAAASLFGAASLYGYTTRKNLCGWGVYLCMLSAGVLVAVVLNVVIFKFNGLCLLMSLATVVIFTAVTAWETQMIKDMYAAKSTSEQREAQSIFGAFQLYGSFMMIFSRLLRLFWWLESET